jgi:predicted AAA+ superfamily ATPase
MFTRNIDIIKPIKDISLFLLGPRQTGKSTLLRSQFPDAKIFDLLDPELFRDLNKSPSLLKELIAPIENNIIIIDEIQKLPELLDVVHSMIEQDKSRRFILTGSSARKLKKQGQNLLGGRAYPLYLHPITSQELKTSPGPHNIESLLLLGGLPQVLTANAPFRILKAYVGVYLQEEIKAEGYARNLGDFSKFLEVAALTNSEQLDFAGVGRDVQLTSKTVAAYYSILQDTLIGHLLAPFRETVTRKSVSTPKFYYFDVGVCNFLTGREFISKGTPEYGKALEHFIFTELKAYYDYTENNFEIFYWRSTSQFEVDFIIRLKSKKLIGIEVKGTGRIDKDDLKGLKAFEDDFKLFKKIIICNEKEKRIIDEEFLVYPLQEFCDELWASNLF